MIAIQVSKYVAYARIAMARGRRERAELYGRVLFFAVILGVFSSLWRAVAEAGVPIAANPKALVWYLAATEWIVLSVPQIHFDIQESIRRGDVVYLLGRPSSYLLAELAGGLGIVALRMPFLAVTAFCCALAFTGWVPPLGSLAIVVPFGIVAAALLTALHLGIGVLAFWLQDVYPVFWVWQKLMFVFGGLMLPIQLYPGFVQRAAALTPFPATLFGPASFVLATGAVTPAALAAQLLVWCVVTTLVLHWMFSRAVSTLTINGG